MLRHAPLAWLDEPGIAEIWHALRQTKSKMPERSSYERKTNIDIPNDNPNGAILFQSNLNVKLTFALCENCGAQSELAREQIFWNYRAGEAEGAGCGVP
jgi:hypothetical protein